MSIRVELDSIEMRPGATGHPYPIQIGMQTEEFLQAVVFYVILADVGAGQRIRQPGAIQEIEKELLDNGMNPGAMNDGWRLVGKYKAVLSESAILNAPIILRSHWDWYLRKLAGFIAFAIESSGAILEKGLAKEILVLGKKEMPLDRQLETIRETTKLKLPIKPNIMEAAQEMSLVRNIGLHNRWEVDDVYLSRSANRDKWKRGEIRLVNSIELATWRAALSEILISTWPPISELYISAPPYQAR